MAERSSDITFFIVVCLSLILLMGLFILSIIFISRKKQLKTQEVLAQMRSKYDNDILKAELEMQEQTFQEISREIHDNINLSLTLAKLKLNTITTLKNELCLPIEMIGKAINELTDLSRSLNSDIIRDCGLISALKMELDRIKKINPLKVELIITGTPIFLESRKELFIFRIIQEAFNNILKHSKADDAMIQLHYETGELKIRISDNGCGFLLKNSFKTNNHYPSAGLINMQKRIELLQGKSNISSQEGIGTTLFFSIPISDYA